MRKNLLNLLALPLVIGVFAGCGSSSDDPVVPKTCEYPNTIQSIDAGGTFTMATATLNGTAVAVTSAPALDTVDNTTEGASTAVTFTGNGCENTASGTLSVNDPVDPDNPVTKENILPN